MFFSVLHNCVTCVTITHDITSYPLPKFKIKKSKMKSKNKINGKEKQKRKKINKIKSIIYSFDKENFREHRNVPEHNKYSI